jgi:hypothetical protein
MKPLKYNNFLHPSALRQLALPFIMAMPVITMTENKLRLMTDFLRLWNDGGAFR